MDNSSSLQNSFQHLIDTMVILPGATVNVPSITAMCARTASSSCLILYVHSYKITTKVKTFSPAPPPNISILGSNFNTAISVLPSSLPPSYYLYSFLLSFWCPFQKKLNNQVLLSFHSACSLLPTNCRHWTSCNLWFPYECDKVQAGFLTQRSQLSGDGCNWRTDTQSKADSCPQELGVQCGQIFWL